MTRWEEIKMKVVIVGGVAGEFNVECVKKINNFATSKKIANYKHFYYK